MTLEVWIDETGEVRFIPADVGDDTPNDSRIIGARDRARESKGWAYCGTTTIGITVPL